MLHDFIDRDVIINARLSETLQELFNTQLSLGFLFRGPKTGSQNRWCFTAYHEVIMEK